MKHWQTAGIAVTAFGIALVCLHNAKTPPRASGPLNQQAYVWQRDWNPSVTDAISTHLPDFDQLAILNAEVSWRNHSPNLAVVPIDYSLLRNAQSRIGLALRIGSYSGTFKPGDETTAYLVDLAESLVARARSSGVTISELQIDFDCAESKLDGYRIWVEAIAGKLAPTPVVITALPSWLDQSAFKRLAKSSGGFVLQVHSLELPHNADASLTLCDVMAARKAVERAARIDMPFRVALPTFGYRVLFDAGGRCVSVTAEEPPEQGSSSGLIREVNADPRELAGLVADWMTNRPARLTGIIWYRLPVRADSLNWSWPTLSAVMSGRVPSSDVTVEIQFPGSGLVEFDLVNRGDANCAKPLEVRANWRGARMISCDGLGGFETGNEEFGAEALTFHGVGSPALKPGEHRTIGWLRLDKESEVHAELVSN